MSTTTNQQQRQSLGTVFKSIHSRPRIDQLTTEKFTKDADDVFEAALETPKFSKTWDLLTDSSLKRPDFPKPEEASKLAPSVKINLDDIAKRSSFDSSNNNNNNLSATWMGHASFLVQVDGVNILTDPVFSDRASPVQFAGIKRYVPPPCKIEDLPRVDIVTISHNHYDHLDTNTVEKLHKTFNPIFVVPRGMKTRWFTSLGWPKSDVENRVFELGWYKVVEIAIPSENAFIPSRIVQITFCPVQHWTQRGVFDRNKELWGGFVVEHYRTKQIEHNDNKFFYYPLRDADQAAKNPTFVSRWFHSGDTGYNEKFFKEIGREFGRDDVNDTSISPDNDDETKKPNVDDDETDDQQQQKPTDNKKPPLFDLALIPIGAYHPRSFLKGQHVDPDQAVIIFQEIGGAKLGLGMHWGTFILTYEPLDEPPKLLKESCEKRGVGEEVFVAPKHGESFLVPLKI